MVNKSLEDNRRKRVRTGCLTCRARRRKCDEAKPTCNNCKEKDLECRYGLNVTFVGSQTEGRSVARNPRSAIQKYSKIRFVNEGKPQRSREEPTTLENVDVPVQQQDFQPQITNEDVSHLAEREADIVFNDAPTEPQLYQENVNYADEADSSDQQRPQRSLNVFAKQHELEQQPLRGETERLSSQDEIDFLIHYQYNISPTIDLGIANSEFGVAILTKTSKSRLLFCAILAVATQHRAQTDSTSFNSSMSAHYATMVETQLQDDYNLIAQDVKQARILLMWREIMTVGPEQWLRTMLKAVTPIKTIVLSQMSQEQSLVLLRVCTAASLLHDGDTDIGDWLQGVDFQSSTDCDDVCLNAPVFSALILLLKVFQDQAVSSASGWKRTWKECQDWYIGRADTMQPIFDLFDHESGNESAWCFPTVLFSNACAAVANIVHHVTAFILLSRKPRLLKASGGSKSSASLLWHTQRIVGIAASTDEPGVLDPFVVAALIKVSERLSHQSQRSFVADILEKASKATGLKLGSPISRLRQS